MTWAPWNPVPAKGMVRLWAYEAFAHGAELVSYFRWRQAPFAQEQMHSGLNLPDNTLSPGGREVARAAQEIATSASLTTLAQSGPAPRAQVASANRSNKRSVIRRWRPSCLSAERWRLLPPSQLGISLPFSREC